MQFINFHWYFSFQWKFNFEYNLIPFYRSLELIVMQKACVELLQNISLKTVLEIIFHKKTETHNFKFKSVVGEFIGKPFSTALQENFKRKKNFLTILFQAANDDTGPSKLINHALR